MHLVQQRYTRVNCPMQHCSTHTHYSINSSFFYIKTTHVQAGVETATMQQIASSTSSRLPSPLPHLYKLCPLQLSTLSIINSFSLNLSFAKNSCASYRKMVYVFYFPIPQSLHVLFTLPVPCQLPTSIANSAVPFLYLVVTLLCLFQSIKRMLYIFSLSTS